MLDRDIEYRKMADCERDHWWYRALHDQCIQAIDGLRSDKFINILDAACGTGGLLMKLRSVSNTRLYGFDLSPTAVRHAQQQSLNVEVADLRGIARCFTPVCFDAIVSNDSLYFLSNEEQESMLRACHDRLNPGGRLILNLPARAAFAGAHDEAVGIGRRFELADVNRLCRTAPWRVLSQRSWPMLLSPLILVERARQRRQRLRHPDHVPESDVQLPPSLINTACYGLTRFERVWPGPTFGSSFFLVLEKARAIHVS